MLCFPVKASVKGRAKEKGKVVRGERFIEK